MIHFCCTRLRAGLVAGALLCGVVAGGARAEDKDAAPPLKLSVAVGPAYALGQAAERWAKRIGEKSDGKLAVKVHPGAVLSMRDPTLEYAALRDGGADLAIGSTLAWSSDVPALGVVSLPWLAPEPAQLDALAAGTVGEALLAACARKGTTPLALAPLGHHEIALRPRAVRTPEDVAGLKVRIATSPALIAMYGALRATPLTMPFGQLRAAFAAGVVDAQDGTAATFAGAHLDAMGLKWVVQWGAVAEIAVFAVNPARWNTLTEPERAILRDTAREVAAELPALVRKEEDAAVETLRKGGMTVVRLTPAGRAAFAAATRSAYDKLAAEAGADLARMAEEAVKQTSLGPGSNSK